VAAGFSDEAYEAAGVEVVKTAAALWKAATSSPRCARPPRPRLKRLTQGPDADLLLLPLARTKR
jgi:NAD(P) transhydrogenase subunit alpha